MAINDLEYVFGIETKPVEYDRIVLLKYQPYRNPLKMSFVEECFDENEYFCIKVSWAAYWNALEWVKATFSDRNTRWKCDAVSLVFKFAAEKDRTIFLLKWQ